MKIQNLKNPEFQCFKLSKFQSFEVSKFQRFQDSNIPTQVHVRVPKMVFKIAIDNQASCMILAHNHPSGNLNPSQADIKLTKKLKNGGEMLDIRILDHVIISEKGYFSFADEGMI